MGQKSYMSHGCRVWFIIIFFVWANNAMISFSNGTPFDQTKIMKIMTELMKKPYERSTRPLYNEAPLYIRTGLFVHAINEFNEKTQDITLSLTMKQSWFESRLTFNSGLVPNDTIQMTPEQGKLLWNPNTVIQNEKKPSVMLPGHEYIRLNCEGHITTSVRMIVTTSCPKDYSNFPFDSRTCQVILTSYSYDKKDLFFEWENDQTGMKSHLYTTEFQVISFTATANMDPRYPDVSLIFKIHLKRFWQSYYRSYFSPMKIFTTLSLLTLWFANTKYGIVFNFVNLLLMNIFLAIQKRNEVLPAVPDRTAIDLYTTMCYFFVFASLLVNFLLMYFEKNPPSEDIKPVEEPSPPESPIPEKKDTTELIFEVEEGEQPGEEGKKELKKKSKKRDYRKQWIVVKCGLHTFCQHAYLILLVSFILCNVFYWGVYLTDTAHRSK